MTVTQIIFYTHPMIISTRDVPCRHPWPLDPLWPRRVLLVGSPCPPVPGPPDWSPAGPRGTCGGTGMWNKVRRVWRQGGDARTISMKKRMKSGTLSRRLRKSLHIAEAGGSQPSGHTLIRTSHPPQEVISEPCLLPAVTACLSSADLATQGKALCLLLLLMEHESFCRWVVKGSPSGVPSYMSSAFTQ